MEPHIYGVTEVNQLVKGLLDSAPALQGVAVRGELSNYKIYPSGHHYFTLKDQEGALRCVMFRGQASRLRFRPENGMKAVASGRITVFPRDGAYQLYCDSLIPEGVGDLAAEDADHVVDRRPGAGGDDGDFLRIGRQGLFVGGVKQALLPQLFF